MVQVGYVDVGVDGDNISIVVVESHALTHKYTNPVTIRLCMVLAHIPLMSVFSISHVIWTNRAMFNIDAGIGLCSKSIKMQGCTSKSMKMQGYTVTYIQSDWDNGDSLGVWKSMKDLHVLAISIEIR